MRIMPGIASGVPVTGDYAVVNSINVGSSTQEITDWDQSALN